MSALLAQATPEPSLVARLLATIDFQKVIAALAVAAAAYLGSRLLTGTLDRLAEGNARRRLFAKKLGSFVRLGIFVLASYFVIMVLLEGQRAVLLGLGGTLLVASGLAMKDTVSSVVSGILILIDQPFQVGDRVRFGRSYGEVTDIGLRAVRILTLDKEVVSIPNNNFLTGEVASSSAGTLDMKVVMDFHIAVTEDHQLAKELVYESCVSSRYVFLEKPVQMVVTESEGAMGASTTVTCKAHVIDARYESSFVTDVTERVRRAFREHRIQRPYLRTYEVRSVEFEDDAPDGRRLIHDEPPPPSSRS